MLNNKLTVHNQTFSLSRFPINHFDKSLRAWDAADEYLIKQLLENNELHHLQQIVIINDSFGALTCAMLALAPNAQIDVYIDSFMSKKGIQTNLKNNGFKFERVTFKSSLALSDDAQNKQSSPDLILVKIPRTHSYLEFLLIEINKLADSKSRIMAGAMVKLISSSVMKIFDKHLANVSSSLAYKKSRLVFAEAKPEHQQASLLPHQVEDKDIGFTLYNHANTFCREQVDIGARYMLKSMPKSLPTNNTPPVIIDLGCGNGILGITLLNRFKEAKVVFVDESYMAIASAKTTLMHAQDKSNQQLIEQIDFLVSHSLSEYQGPAADLIVCNPPFHQQSTQTDDIAWQMFLDAKKVLKVGGELRIVGNRHLDHRQKLSKLFGGCKVIASDKKFVVLSSIKQSD